MKKRRFHVKKRFHIFKDTSFLQRMVLVYVIGGIIPLLGSSIYTNFQTRSMMIDLSKETQSEEVSLVASSIGESVTVLENVARLLCLSEEIQKLATKEYSGSTQFFKDYYSTSAITEYLNYYQQDISYINVYLKNPSVNRNFIEKADHISYLSESVQRTRWYKKTVAMEDAAYWYYGKGTRTAKKQGSEKEPNTGKEPETPKQAENPGELESLKGTDTRKSIQVSRAMRNEQGEVIAVVRILMQYKKIDAITERNVNTALLYNNSDIVCANYDAEEKYSFLRANLDGIEGTSVSQNMTHGVEEYLVAYEKLVPGGSSDYYSLVSIQNYQDIMANVNRISMRAFLPEIMGMMASVILILVFSAAYGRRMNQLHLQMNRVAQGKYTMVEPIEGNDEIGELYQELEQMMRDIQRLMADVVNEQVQKEKLHTRQKEVEFKMLASQINPHFLYNTLETIRMKAMVNKQPEIAELVKMLAKTMRYNIQVTDQLVSLRAEVQMVEYYLRIQEYRFGDRITSCVEIDPDVDMNAPVLPLLIQPFVENAFVHGLEEMDSGGRLRIHVGMNGEDIQISILDNGAGMDYYELGSLRQSLRRENPDRTHIGIRNVNQRIKILYGDRYGIQVHSKEKLGTRVVINIPYRPDGDKNL